MFIDHKHSIGALLLGILERNNSNTFNTMYAKLIQTSLEHGGASAPGLFSGDHVVKFSRIE